MTRLAPVALAGALLLAPVARTADPVPLVEKQLALQTAMSAARKHLDANQPADAVAVLEREISAADGHKGFLNLLREAYQAELSRAEGADPERAAQLRRRLALLGGEPKPVAPPVPTVPATVPEPNLGPPLVADDPGAPTATPVARPAADAVAAFKRGDYAAADRAFAALGAERLAADQKAAWAYCRIKLAADRVNAPGCDPNTAASAVQELTAALQLAPTSAELQKVGAQVLKVAQSKAGAAKATGPATPQGEAVETPSFRVFGGSRELADSVAKAAEAGRKQIFERWSGPPGGAWQPKCDIVIHPTAEAYAKATGTPAALTGHATVTLNNGRPTARRIDLRADDPALVSNALPRELTHVVLADLFADAPPPRWALEGMAVLAGSPDEVARYTRTLSRCARDGELRSLAALFELKDVPNDKITGFYCQSVSVAEYLIGLNGERNFKIFLSDAQRYGAARALKRQYNIDGPQALEAAWKRAALTP